MSTLAVIGIVAAINWGGGLIAAAAYRLPILYGPNKHQARMLLFLLATGAVGSLCATSVVVYRLMCGLVKTADIKLPTRKPTPALPTAKVVER